ELLKKALSQVSGPLFKGPEPKNALYFSFLIDVPAKTLKLCFSLNDFVYSIKFSTVKSKAFPVFSDTLPYTSLTPSLFLSTSKTLGLLGSNETLLTTFPG